MIRKTLSILSLLFLFVSFAFSQSGNIKGSIYDEKTGESIIAANISVLPVSLGIGTTADLDGKFYIELNPGKYDIQISFISYQTKIIKDIVVNAGESTNLDNLKLSESSYQIEDIEVVVQSVRNNETALVAMKRNSPNVIDGISASRLKKTGDSDVASSIKRVSGISVQEGKYVYVRGLGDRYTKTMMNGLEIPGLDPDKNTLQMDLFPTNIIDNIIVHKSFTADLPADFTGGVVDISMKNFPEEKIGTISLNLGYNPFFHFKSDYLTYKGGSTDFLGFDDGTRAIPATDDIPFFAYAIADPDGDKAKRYKEILGSFNPTMSTYKSMSLMDAGIGFSLGNQKIKGEKTIGYLFSLSYKNNTEFFENAEYSRYGLNQSDPGDYSLDIREHQKGNFGVNNVLLSSMAGFGVKTKSNKIRVNLLHIQNGENKAGVFNFEGSDQGSDFISIQHNLEYSQRSLTNLLIDAKHIFKNKDWQLNWKLSPTYSRVYDPDIRFTRYEIRDGGYNIGTEVGFPERIWRDLSEISIATSIQATKEYAFHERNSKLKFGGSFTNKSRDYSIRKFALNVRDIALTGDPNEIFFEENIWPNAGSISSGTTYEADFYPKNSNSFNANTQNAGIYVTNETELFPYLNAVVGLRAEKFTQFYTGKNQQGSLVLNNEKVLDDFNMFPSINLNYKLTKIMNLRFSYSSTIARPSFKELSYAEIYDPLTGRTFIGGFFKDQDNVSGITYWDGNLKSSKIQNLDLRWEMLDFNGQMLSVSTFYKSFNNPIEIVQFATQTGAYQPRNVGDAEVLGVEIEARYNLINLTDYLSQFSFSINASIIESKIELSKTEYDSRLENARQGEKINKFRDMSGQSPYLLNIGLSYENEEVFNFSDFKAGLYYNVQGPTLLYAGIVDRPDIYVNPFNSLNFSSSFSLKDKRFKAGVKISNLLNSKKEMVYKSYKSEDQIFTRLKQGQTFSLSVSYNFI